MTLIQEARERGESLAGNIMYQQFAEQVSCLVPTTVLEENCC